MLNRKKQQGAVLITGLIFMVVLTLLAVAAMRSTSLEEKMSANAMNQDLAFQAAEAALRQGVALVNSGAITSTSGFVGGCSATGLCLPSTTATPIWNTVFPFGQTASSVLAATLSGTALNAVANQPQYIIELLPNVPVTTGNSIVLGRSPGSGTATPFRITARGWGQAAEAQATTQAATLY
ncbi:MAG: pilus assembly PilX family protein [Sulfuriferula sp.]